MTTTEVATSRVLIEQLAEIRAQRDHVENLLDFLERDYKYGAGYAVAERLPIRGVPAMEYQETFRQAVERAFCQNRQSG